MASDFRTGGLSHGGNYGKSVYDQLVDVMERLDAMESECKKSHKEIKSFNAEVKSLRNENTRLKEELADMKAQNVILLEENAVLRKENQQILITAENQQKGRQGSDFDKDSTLGLLVKYVTANKIKIVLSNIVIKEVEKHIVAEGKRVCEYKILLQKWNKYNDGKF